MIVFMQNFQVYALASKIILEIIVQLYMDFLLMLQ